MTYEKSGKIEAADLNNNLINPVTGITTLNGLWGTGYGSRGYGQSSIIPAPEPGDIIRSSDWSNMNTLAAKLSGHQGVAVSTDTFTPGGRVLYNNGLTRTMINSLITSRTSSKIQAPYYLKSIANDYGWFNKLTYTITFTFPTADEARYFFNCGGQFAVRTWQPGINSNGIRRGIAQLSIDMGTIYWTVTPGAGGTTKIAGVNYAATTKIGGSGSAAVIATGQDFYTPSTYSETNTPTTIFKQFVKSGITGYDQSFISLGVYSKGDKGVNGGNGNIVVMDLVVDIAPQSVFMPSGGIVYVYVIGPDPDTTFSYLEDNSWATPTVDIAVTGI